MKRFGRSWPVAIALLVPFCLLSAQQHTSLTMSAVMTKDEYTEAGIDSLSKPQKEALDRWLDRYTAKAARYFQSHSSTPTTPVPRLGDSCAPAIETSIDGDFNGWEGETIFKLSNGQIWQQSEYSYTYSYSYHPDVTIYSTKDGCRMKVEDEDETIQVKRIK